MTTKTAMEASALQMDWQRKYANRPCECVRGKSRVDQETNYVYPIPETFNQCNGIVKVKIQSETRWEYVNIAPKDAPRKGDYKAVKRYRVAKLCSVCGDGWMSKWFVEPFRGYYEDSDIPF